MRGADEPRLEWRLAAVSVLGGPRGQIVSSKSQEERKALIRRYKETPRPMGIFRVHNTVSDRSYVGASRDLPSVLNRERFWLSHGSHPNRPLQEDWNHSGPTAFVFEVLDTLSPADRSASEVSEDLAVLEQLWLEKLGERGYNASAHATPRSPSCEVPPNLAMHPAPVK